MYPLDIQYKHSVQNKIYPPNNGGYVFTPVMEEDEVVFSAGGKACVFKVKDDGDNKTKALKLFTLDSEDRFHRFKQIAKALQAVPSNIFVGFSFIPKLIFVKIENQADGECYFPGLVMDWVEGVTLATKISELCEKKNISALEIIANNFKKLSLFLLINKLGHGDLKHDNILVDNELDLILVDYDGMYVSELSGLKSNELGTDSFQHPCRTYDDFNDRIDDFSILTLYTSLVALSINPDWYERFNDQQNLLFTKSDFLDPDNSEIFKIFLCQKEIWGLTHFIKKSLTNNSIYIENVIDLLNGIYPKPIIKYFKSDKELVFDTQKFSLCWESENGISAAIEGYGDVELNGSLQLAAVGQSYFKLKVSNQFGETSQDLSIIRFPTPIIESLKVPIPIFESRINLSPITIQSPNINVSINFEISKLSQVPVSFTRPNEELINVRPLFKKETTTWNISEIFNKIKKRMQ